MLFGLGFFLFVCMITCSVTLWFFFWFFFSLSFSLKTVLTFMQYPAFAKTVVARMHV